MHRFKDIPEQYKYADMHIYSGAKFYGAVKRTFLHGEIIYSEHLPEISMKIQKGRLMTRSGLLPAGGTSAPE